jgi:phosphohistidine phosphatase
MEIYLIRHAIAEDRENWHESDDLRPLTKEGGKKMQRIARGLRALDVEFTHLYSSGLTRALQTADFVRKALSLEDIRETEALTPDAAPQDILPVINELPADAVVGLVGHEPHMSTLLGFLLTGQRGSFAIFKKGGIACLEANHPVEPGKAMLKWMLEPRQLMAIGKVK